MPIPVDTLEQAVLDLCRLRERLLETTSEDASVDPDAASYFTLAMAQVVCAEQYLTLALYHQRRNLPRW